ncbi:MAG: carboxypeptidase-like regulatory domain-containing protein [Actinomycetota bacterium]
MTRLSGRVTVHGSKPAATATVELHNSAGDVVDQVQVDQDGRYTYHLSSGEWSVHVWDAHGHRGHGQITLSEGDEKTLDLDLEEPEGGH